MKFRTTLFALLLLAASCSKTAEPGVHPEAGTLRVTVGSGPRLDIAADTRTALGDDGTTVRWCDGDEIALWALDGAGAEAFSAVAVGLQVCAFLLLSGLRVPFRAPLEPSLWSSDRFWLSRGLRLFVPLVAVAFSAGLMLGRCGGAGFYLSLGVGFWLALCLHVLLFGPHLQRELAAGYALLLLAFLLYSWEEASGSGAGWAAGCLGCGLGLVSSRYLLSCIRICAHCERATAQNTYLLAWESGLLAGYSVAAVPLKNLDESSMATGAAVVAAAGIFHGLCVRRWYAAHKRK